MSDQTKPTTGRVWVLPIAAEDIVPVTRDVVSYETAGQLHLAESAGTVHGDGLITNSAQKEPEMPQPKIVTICGSTRFRSEMAKANRELTLAGYIVLAPGVFAHDGDEITDEEKQALDALHFQKIDLARWIYVVNPGGYIGESTRREIEYARKTGKGVLALVDIGIDGWDT